MSVDIIRLLEKLATQWDHIPSGEQAIRDAIEKIKDAEKHGYLGVLYRTDYVVEGTGQFPVDMLRYTQSWPKGEHDVALIQDSQLDRLGGPITITLTKYHRDPAPVLSENRWLSKFRWRVVRVIDTVEC